jgi:hypothetical protein
MNHRKVLCEDEKCIEPAQDHVQMHVVALAVLNTGCFMRKLVETMDARLNIW